MKVVTGETMQLMDRRSIEEFRIPGLLLMEKAGAGCAEILCSRFGERFPRNAVIVAGKGNNGGDGYVIARLLAENGWEVTTFILARHEDVSGDAAANLARLDRDTVHYCPDPGGLQAFSRELVSATVIVDALFGTGLKNPLRGIFLEAVNLINRIGNPVVAVDIPSGVDASTGKVMGVAVRAEMTVTFALPKLGHVLYPGAELCGEVRIVDIGMPPEVMAAAPGYEYLDRETVAALIRRRPRTEHKGGCGHALIVAGSTGKSGAAAMSANSAVRAGAGLVTVAVPESIHAVLEVKTTEAMTVPLPDRDGMLRVEALPRIAELSEGKAGVALGPGIGWSAETVRLVHNLIEGLSLPLVLDADALNAVSETPEILLRKRSAAVILTPHPGEMARLAGMTAAAVEADRIAAALTFAGRYGVGVVLKGARTIIAAPDGRVAINGSGNPGMATGGMGDVLTGILVALLAQGYDPFTACRLGVFLHGHAADRVAAIKGEVGMSAVDVQEALPAAHKDLLDGQ